MGCCLVWVWVVFGVCVCFNFVLVLLYFGYLEGVCY